MISESFDMIPLNTCTCVIKRASVINAVFVFQRDDPEQSWESDDEEVDVCGTISVRDVTRRIIESGQKHGRWVELVAETTPT